MEKVTKEDLKKINNQLYEIRGDISRSYSQVGDCIEQELYSMKKIYDSGTLNRKELLYYQDQLSKLHNMMNNCEEEKEDSMKLLKSAITESEEYLFKIEKEEYNEEEEKEDIY